MSARQELRRLRQLAVPIVGAQLGMTFLGVVDTMMVGRVSVEALSAVALGHIWTFGTLIFAMGVVFGIDPIITQAHGAQDEERMGLALQRGLVVAGIASLPTAGLWLVTAPVLELFGQSQALARLAHDYAIVQIPAIPLYLGFVVLRQYLQGRGIVRPALIVVVVANLLNVLFNWAFIFGHLGMPRLEVVGAGIATALTRGLLFGLMLMLMLRGRLFEGAWVPWSLRSLRWNRLEEILHHGLSIGIQYSLEVWAFQIAALMAGRLGEFELAAHTIVINMVSVSFMFPFGISQAATTRVGNLLGARQPQRAQLAGWVAFGMSAGVMGFFAIGFAALRHRLPLLYNDDATVLAFAASVLPIAAAFQLFDGTQAVGGGILRGMGRTRPAAVFNLIGYYLMALPLAWWLAFEQGYGIAGIWWGLALGLALIATALLLWVRRFGPSTVRV